jgi:hypothetical protein
VEAWLELAVAKLKDIRVAELNAILGSNLLCEVSRTTTSEELNLMDSHFYYKVKLEYHKDRVNMLNKQPFALFF